MTEEEIGILELDSAAIETLAEIDIQERIALASLQSSAASSRMVVISYFLKQKGIQGNWKLSDSKRELIKV